VEALLDPLGLMDVPLAPLVPLAREMLTEPPLREANPWRDVTSTGRSTPVSGIPVLSRNRARNTAGTEHPGGIRPAGPRAVDTGGEAGKAVAPHRAPGRRAGTEADSAAGDSVEHEAATVA
jgi:hypothetical protein